MCYGIRISHLCDKMKHLLLANSMSPHSPATKYEVLFVQSLCHIYTHIRRDKQQRTFQKFSNRVKDILKHANSSKTEVKKITKAILYIYVDGRK